MGLIKINQAIVSTANKDGLPELATGLDELGIKMISTGGTYDAIIAAGAPAIKIETFTGMPEVMGGRVKTLHHKVYMALLARLAVTGDADALHGVSVEQIDLIIGNLYRFEETVAKPDVTQDDIIENIDIGGNSMARAGAKNWKRVVVITDPADYGILLTALKENDGACMTNDAFRWECARKVFELTRNYDDAIEAYFAANRPE